MGRSSRWFPSELSSHPDVNVKAVICFVSLIGNERRGLLAPWTVDEGLGSHGLVVLSYRRVCMRVTCEAFLTYTLSPLAR